MVVKTERLMTYGVMCIFIGIMLSVFQQAVGINAVLYYAPRIFGDMGMENPMVVTVFMGVINILFTLVAIFTVEKWGRKPLLITGSLGMAVGAFGVAVTFGHAGLEMVTAISIMVYSASFMFSWGPICWVLIAEIFPNTIRGAAVAIAVAFQWIFNFIVSSTFVPMFNMHLTEGDDFGHWFTYGLYGIICVVAAIFVWKLVPETKGKTLEDMTKLWKNRGERFFEPSPLFMRRPPHFSTEASREKISREIFFKTQRRRKTSRPVLKNKGAEKGKWRGLILSDFEFI